MAILLKTCVFNQKINKKSNKKFLLFFKKNLGVFLRTLKVDPNFKFTVLMQLNEVDDYLNLDPKSFKKVILDKMIKIRKEVSDENQQRENLLSFIDKSTQSIKI